MKDQMKAEVKKVVDRIYRDPFHKDYLDHDAIVYEDIFRLCRQVMRQTVISQKRKNRSVGGRSSNVYSSQWDQSVGQSGGLGSFDQRSQGSGSPYSQRAAGTPGGAGHRRARPQSSKMQEKKKIEKQKEADASNRTNLAKKGRRLSPGIQRSPTGATRGNVAAHNPSAFNEKPSSSVNNKNAPAQPAGRDKP